MMLFIILLCLMAAAALTVMYSALILASDYDDTMEELEREEIDLCHTTDDISDTSECGICDSTRGAEHPGEAEH